MFLLFTVQRYLSTIAFDSIAFNYVPSPLSLCSLNGVGHLNWWTSTGKLPRLEPLATSGDGNCLLHAASLYMWGFHDRELILRTALHRLLTTGREAEGIRRRWKLQTGIRNEEAVGLKFSDEEWDFEWSDVTKIATNQPRGQPTTESLRRYGSLRVRYESLEEVHIFALAHVLRRPVIVIADKVLRGVGGEEFAPVYFRGIYLPLEVSPTLCYKSPVVLAYDASHFSALVAKEQSEPRKQSRYGRMSGRQDVVIPLVDPSGALLPVQFIVDPENRNVDEKWAKMGYTPVEFPPEIIHVLESYLEIRWIQLSAVPTTSSQTPAAESTTDDANDYDHLFPVQVPKVRFPAAVITHEAQPIYQKELVEKYLENARERFKDEQKRRRREEEEKAQREAEARLRRPVPCEGPGCTMFGTASTNNLCSVCYQKSLEKSGQSEDDGEQDVREYRLHEVVLEEEPWRPPPPPYKEAVRRPAPPPPSPKRSNSVDAPQPSHSPPSSDSRSRPNQSTEQTQLPKDTNAKPSPPDHSSKDMPKPPSPKTSPSKKADASRQSGWRKKLQITSGFIPGLYKRSNSSEEKSGGYARDKIQPIGVQTQEPAVAVAGVRRTRCISAGCQFYGSEEMQGMCSKCYLELEEATTLV